MIEKIYEDSDPVAAITDICLKLNEIIDWINQQEIEVQEKPDG